jgi:hypothetical protein
LPFLLLLKVVPDPLTGSPIEATPSCFGTRHVNNEELVTPIDVPDEAIANLDCAVLGAKKPGRIQVVPPQRHGFQGVVEGGVVLARSMEVVRDEDRAHLKPLGSIVS